MKYETYMKICRFLVVDVYLLKSVRFVLFWSKLGIFISVLLQTLDLVRYEVDYFVQYGPSYFIVLYALICLLIQPLLIELNKLAQKSVDQNCFQKAAKIVQKKIEKRAYYATIFMIWITIASALVAISMMVPTKDDDDLIFAFNLSKTRLGKMFWKNLSRCLVVPVSYVSSAISCSNLMYFLLVIDPQVQLCLHGIKNLTTRAALINHKEIAKTLKLLISYHSSTSGLVRYIAKRTQFLVLPLEILGTAVLMSIGVFYFWLEGSLKGQYLRVGALAIASFTALTGTAVVGQEIEDYTGEIFDALVQVDWCDWNESNKKMYLMLLISLSKPIKIKFSENISVNYELGIQMAKTFFSTISVMDKLRKSKSGGF